MLRTIVLNDNYTFEIDGFSRNSNVQDGKLVSSAYVTLKDPTDAVNEELRGLALYTITDLKLKADDTMVYHLDDLDAQITSIDESFGEDGKMRTNFHIRL